MAQKLSAFPLQHYFPKWSFFHLVQRYGQPLNPSGFLMRCQGQQRGDAGGGQIRGSSPISPWPSGSSYLALALMQSSSRGLSVGPAVPKEPCLSLACLCNIWGPWAVLGWPRLWGMEGLAVSQLVPSCFCRNLAWCSLSENLCKSPQCLPLLKWQKAAVESPGHWGEGAEWVLSAQQGRRQEVLQEEVEAPNALGPSLPPQLQPHTLGHPK